MSCSHNQTGSILLSGEEILGLVVDDNNSDHNHNEGLLADSDHTFLSSSIRSCPNPWTDTTSSAAADVPPPPQQRRAVTWSFPETNNAHSIQRPAAASTFEPNTKNDLHYYAARANNSCSESSDEEVSLDGSMTTNAPNSPVGPRRPSTVYQHQPSGDNNRCRTQQRFRGMETTTDHQAHRLLRSNTGSSTESFYPRLVETFIEPFDETARDTTRTTDHVKQINAPKKPSSRFEIFENKMREEEETFGFLL